MILQMNMKHMKDKGMIDAKATDDTGKYGRTKEEEESRLDPKCWKGYHKEGNKKMFGKTYPNCVKNTNEEEQLDESFMQVSRINRVLKKNGFELYNDNISLKDFERRLTKI